MYSLAYWFHTFYYIVSSCVKLCDKRYILQVKNIEKTGVFFINWAIFLNKNSCLQVLLKVNSYWYYTENETMWIWFLPNKCFTSSNIFLFWFNHKMAVIYRKEGRQIQTIKLESNLRDVFSDSNTFLGNTSGIAVFSWHWQHQHI